MKKIYVDYAATTPVDPRVLKAMIPYFNRQFGNTMSFHSFGQEANAAVEKSRNTIARFINADPEEIYFTGSATESNNMTLKGVAVANKSKGRHIIISSIEHDCILESARSLEKQGFEVTRLPVDKYGLIDLHKLDSAITKETILVSIIHGNNEIGTIQDIGKIGSICKNRGVYFHTDASQSFGKITIDVRQMKIDLLTASSHKIYGPKGAALLYVKKGVAIEPILHGGGHENNLRSSTVNVPSIVGFAKATEIYQRKMEKENQRLAVLRDRLINGILIEVKGTYLNGHPIKRLANNINISFPFAEGESIVMELDMAGIACSTGSACSSRTLEPSHVLLAIGLPPQGAHGSIRFSLGRWTKKKDVDYLLKIIPDIIDKIRRISPFKE
jgi:cysteine desulfurase